MNIPYKDRLAVYTAVPSFVIVIWQVDRINLVPLTEYVGLVQAYPRPPLAWVGKDAQALSPPEQARSRSHRGLRERGGRGRRRQACPPVGHAALGGQRMPADAGEMCRIDAPDARTGTGGMFHDARGAIMDRQALPLLGNAHRFPQEAPRHRIPVTCKSQEPS